MRCAVLIPTYQRPDRVLSLTQNVITSGHGIIPYFICERDDKASIEAVVTTPGANLIVNQRSRNYAGAINTGVAETDEPYLFAGADDIRFTAGWFDLAVCLMNKRTEVVGTNDLGNPDVLAGTHATHYLVSRNYATQGVVDQLGIMLHEGYDHNYTDTEFIQTAIARGKFQPCLEAEVEHLHVTWGKATHDAGYTKSFAQAHVDAQRYAERKHLWESL